MTTELLGQTGIETDQQSSPLHQTDSCAIILDEKARDQRVIGGIEVIKTVWSIMLTSSNTLFDPSLSIADRQDDGAFPFCVSEHISLPRSYTIEGKDTYLNHICILVTHFFSSRRILAA